MFRNDSPSNRKNRKYPLGKLEKRSWPSASKNPKSSPEKRFVGIENFARFVSKRTDEKVNLATVVLSKAFREIFNVNLASSKNRIPSVHDHGYFHFSERKG
jgi:hypothetical protein